MAVAFTRDDLLATISEKELALITTKLVNGGEPDAVAAAIERARQTFDIYAGRYLVPEDRQKAILAALTIWTAELRVSVITPKRQVAYDDAMRELREIRDGKFNYLAVVPEEDLPPSAAKPRGKSGGSSLINTSRF